jgi:hypothetical protein
MFRRDPLANKTLFAHQVIDHSLLRRSFAQAQRVIPLICLYASQYGDAGNNQARHRRRPGVP